MSAPLTRNLVLNAIGETLWGLQAALVPTATVITVLLREFGAGKRMIGSLIAIELGATLLLQFAGLWLFASRRHRQRRLLAWQLAAVIPFWFLIAVVVALAPRLDPVVVRWTILLCFAGYYSGIGVAMSAWTDWVAHLFSVTVRGTAMGLAACGARLAGVGGALVAGWLIRQYPSPGVYALIFAIAGGLALVAIIAYWNIEDPGERSPTDTPRPNLAAILAHVSESVRHANFRAFLVGRTLATAGFCVLPFVTLYFTSPDGGGLSDATVVMAGGIALAVGAAIASLAFGRLGDRRGHRVGVIVGAAAQVVTLGTALATTGPVGYVAVFFGAGVCAAAGFVSHFNMLFETCPHDNRIAHIIIGNLVIGIAGITAAFLAGVVAEAWGVRTLFGISLGLSAAALGWFVLVVVDPRDKPVIRAPTNSITPESR